MARHVEDLAMALRVLDRARDPFVDPGPEFERSGGRRHEPPAVCDIHRRRRVSGCSGGAARRRRSGRYAHRGRSKAGRLAAARAQRRVSDLFFACLSADRGPGVSAAVARQQGRPAHPSSATDGGDTECRCAASPVSRWMLSANAVLPSPFAASVPEAPTNIGRRSKRSRISATNCCVRSNRPTAVPIDVIVCPAYPVPAVRHGATELMPMPGAYAPLANVSGFPAGIVPVTRGAAGRRKRPPGKPRSGRPRRAQDRARQRRPADHGAGDRAAMARPRRARRHGRDRRSCKSAAGLSGASAAMKPRGRTPNADRRRRRAIPPSSRLTAAAASPV